MAGGGAGELLGRDAELAALARRLERAAVGDASLVVLEGEAGVGKSRLADAVAERAASAGFTICAGASEELADRPFGPLLIALRLDDTSGPAGAEITRLLRLSPAPTPSLLTATIPEVRARVVDVIADVVAERAAKEPTLLVVEDLHWADTSTFLAVRAVLRRATGLPLLVLATARVSGADDDLARNVQLLADAAAERIELPPLSDEAAVAVARDLLGAEPGPRLRAL